MDRKRQFPLWTVSVLAGALLATCLPGAAALAVGERAAPAAELWRWWTCHLVHFSAGHLAASGLVWCAAAGLLERGHRKRLVLMTLLGAPFILLASLAGDPELARYGGLSGLATAAVTCLGLIRVREETENRNWFGEALLFLVAVKVCLELSQGHDAKPWLAGTSDPQIRVAAYAHLAGAAVGVVAALRWRRVRVEETACP